MTTLTGTLRDSGGNPITGLLYLELSQAGTYNPGGILVTPLQPSTFTLLNGQINGPGVGPYTVYGNDGITPSITFYRLTAFDSYGQQVLRLNVLITGVSQDLGTLVIAPTQSWVLPPGYSLSLAGDVSGLSNANVINPGVVTYSKIQNVTSDRLLGRATAGAGVVEEIPLTAAGRALLDDATAADQRTTLGLGAGALLAVPVALASGGTGQTTAQAALNSLAGGVTSGQYLRGNGANVLLSAIQAADVPTLNQNTSGTAANVTGIVAVANGGTGATDAATARTNLGLGSIATQASSSVSITGGAISGVTLSASSLTDTGLTSGYLPKAGTGGLLGNSPVYTDGTNVGIGTTSPASKLSVSNGGASGFEITPGIAAFGMTDGTYLVSYNRAASAYRDILVDLGGVPATSVYFKVGGSVGIGTTSPATGRLLDVNGIIKATGIQLTTGASNGYVLKSDASGNASWQAGGGGMTYKGTWNANTNTPTLADGTGTAGDTYAVTVGGTQFGRTFTAGGWAIYSGTIWEPVGTSVSVTSVNGLTGAVSLSLASSAFVNQGTTTTVLHGNAAGNPSWGAVSLTADVTGTLTVGNGGTGATTASTARTNLGLGTGDSPTFLGATLSGLTAGYFPKASTGGQLVNGPLQSDGSWLYTDIPVRIAKNTGPTLRLYEAATYAWDLVGGFTTPNDFSIYQGSASQTRFYISPTGATVIGGTTPTSGALLTVNGVASGALWDKGGAVFNVRVYGAIGDGTTDDTGAINAAISAAAALSPRGVVFFPPGTYKTTGGHNLGTLDGIQILGSGVLSTTIRLAHATNDLFYIGTTPTVNLHIGRMRIISDTVTRTGGWIFNVATTYNGGGLLQRSLFEDMEIQTQLNGLRLSRFEFVTLRDVLYWNPTPNTTGIGFQAGQATASDVNQGAELHCFNVQVWGYAYGNGTNAVGEGFHIEDCEAVYMTQCGATSVYGNDMKLVSNAAGHYLRNLFFSESVFDATETGDCVLSTGTGLTLLAHFNSCWFASAGRLGATNAQACGLRTTNSIHAWRISGSSFFNTNGNGLRVVTSANGYVNVTGSTFHSCGIGGATGYRAAIYADVPLNTLAPVITGCSETSSGLYSVETSATTNKIRLSSNLLSTAASYGIAPGLNVNNGF